MQTEARPEVTVIVTFYDEDVFLETAIQSVLVQPLNDVEVIIVNDNPERFGEDFFSAFGFPGSVRVIHHEQNRGLPGARNTGIKAARGAHIAFLDADDYYLPDGLANQLRAAKRSGADITHGQTILTIVNSLGGRLMAVDEEFMGAEAKGTYRGDDVVKMGFPIETCWSIVYRADFLRSKSVWFDEEQVKFEDRIFVIDSIKAAESLTVMGAPCRVWRKRGGSITTAKKSFGDQLLKLQAFEKCVRRWREEPNAGRFWELSEFARQSSQMISLSPTSPWSEAFGFSDSENDLRLTKLVSDFFRSIPITAEEVADVFDVNRRRYAPQRSGNSQVTAQDLYEFIDAVAREEYHVVRDLFDRAFALKTRQDISPLNPQRKPDKTVLFHFGLYETGSAHIQRQLDANRSLLQAHGVLFPKTGFGALGGGRSVRAGDLPGHQALAYALVEEKTERCDEFFHEVETSGCDTVLISPENASRPLAVSSLRGNRMKTLIDRLKSVGPCIPVVTYRRPDVWFESYYREQVGNGTGYAYQTPSEFLINNKQILDFGAVIETLEDACGERAIILPIEEGASAETDLSQAFLNGCGIQFDEDAFSIVDDVKNETACNAQLKVAQLVSSLVKDKQARNEILRTFYAQVEDSGQRGPLLTREERAEIINTFCGSSAGLFAERGLPLPHNEWLEAAAKEESPTVADIPQEYFQALRISSVLNGARPEAREPVPEPVMRRLRAQMEDRGKRAQQAMEVRHESEIAGFYNSNSWRVTKPLRSLMLEYRRIRGIE